MNNNKLLIDKLISLNYTLSAAESCSGGGFIYTLIRIENASKVISESYITYSDEAKSKILNIDINFIKKNMAVSESISKNMALSVKKISNSTIGVGITGLAGPSGDGVNDVGTIFFTFVIKDDVYSYKEIYNNCSRTKVIDSTIAFAINKLLELLKIYE